MKKKIKNIKDKEIKIIFFLKIIIIIIIIIK